MGRRNLPTERRSPLLDGADPLLSVQPQVAVVDHAGRLLERRLIAARGAIRRGRSYDAETVSTPTSMPLTRSWPAYAAAMLAFTSAAVSLYWTFGGTALLDTLGGTFERLARDRSTATLALGIGVVLVKIAGGLLALALVRPWGARF